MITINRSPSKVVRHQINDDILEIMPLGAGSEVGRSSILLKYKNKQILFDCGVHPGYEGLASLPFFDLCSPADVDIVLISHFHLDHCGAVPHFLEHTAYTGNCYMTRPTKAIVSLLLRDFVRVSGDNQTLEMKDQIFTENDLKKIDSRIFGVEYKQEKKVNGIKFCCYNAGHVLGAAMFMVEIAGVRVLYTGDYSPLPDRHLVGAEIPQLSPHILMVEGTYGTGVHESREERELRFKMMVKQVVERDGKCLIPVFALGRAQELLLILDEMWNQTPSLSDSVPIYYASSLAEKCMSIFLAYSNTMNDEIRNEIDNYNRNPFKFKHIKRLRKASEIKNKMGPCVVLASPGMLQSGLSCELYEAWCGDEKNGVIITGYCVEGTPARRIQSEPDRVVLSSGEEVDFRMSVKTISFSAHSDRKMTEGFIKKTAPETICLIHGSKKAVKKLRLSLISKFPATQVYHPKNGERLRIEFKREKVGKMIGNLALKFREENVEWRREFGKLEDEWEEMDDKNKNENNNNNNNLELLDSESEEDGDENDDDNDNDDDDILMKRKKKKRKSSKEKEKEITASPGSKPKKKLSWKDLMMKRDKGKNKNKSLISIKKEKKEKKNNSNRMRDEEEDDEDEKNLLYRNKNKEEEEEGMKNIDLLETYLSKNNIEEIKNDDSMKDEEEEEIIKKEEEKEEEDYEKELLESLGMNDSDSENNNLQKMIDEEEEKEEENEEEKNEEKELEYYDKIVEREKQRKREINGIWLSRDFQTHLIDSSDLKKYFSIPVTGVKQKIILNYPNIEPWVVITPSSSRKSKKKIKNDNNNINNNKLLNYWMIRLVQFGKFPFKLISSSVVDKILFVLNVDVNNNNNQISVSIDKNRPGEVEISWISTKTNDLIVDYLSLELLSQTTKQVNEDENFQQNLKRRELSLNISKKEKLEKLKEVLDEMFYSNQVEIVEKKLKGNIMKYELIIRDTDFGNILIKINEEGKFVGKCGLENEERERLRLAIDRVFLCYLPMFKVLRKI